MQVTVSPVGRDTASLWHEKRPTALVLAVDPEAALASLEERIGAAFALSPMQSALSAELVRGSTVAEAAERLEILPSTARNYLKSIFVRTDTRRQSELVAVVLRSLGAIRVENGAGASLSRRSRSR